MYELVPVGIGVLSDAPAALHLKRFQGGAVTPPYLSADESQLDISDRQA